LADKLQGKRIAFVVAPDLLGALAAFCAKLVEEFCEGTHERQRQTVGSAS
jgi:hypothetical protein